MELWETAEWMEKANCLDQDPELFFPPGEEQKINDTPEILDAKAVCAECQVLGECLLWAVDKRVWGIWGGKRTQERQRMNVHGLLLKGYPKVAREA